MAKDISALFNKILKGDRVALGQAMTLVESDLHDDRVEAIQLLELCHQQSGDQNKSLRLTISGAPGVGKSTLIEAIGLKAISSGLKVGVLTVDPTSTISRGSILGDKSRMQSLSTSPSAFIRSSAAGTVLGGIGRRSFEMITLLEAIGYDIIFLETVGVGQSEHIAWQLTDGFILVIQPGGGDELQGMKRGITELADIIVVNKSDGALKDAAGISKSQYQNALHYLSPLRKDWQPTVMTCSAREGNGIDDLWETIGLYKKHILKTNAGDEERKLQNKFWLSWSLGITAHQLLMNHPLIQKKLKDRLTQIEHQSVPIFKAEYEIEEMMKDLIAPNT